MFERDGVYFAGEPGNLVHNPKLVGLKPLDGYKLWLKFSDHTERIYDFTPYLDTLVFEALRDKTLFNGVTLDHGAPVWDNGKIDFDPCVLYRQGEPPT